MNIIPLREQYLDETIQMTNAIFPEDVDAEWNPEKSFKISLQRNDLATLGYWILLNEGGEVIGVTGLYQRGNEDPKDLVWLGWYGVCADERGKGLGKELLEWTIEKARSEGYKRLRLYTSTDPNEARAQELYEKVGLKVVEEEKTDGDKILYREMKL